MGVDGNISVKWVAFALLAAMFLSYGGPVLAEDEEDSPHATCRHPADLAEMNLEDLIQLEVTSVSKKKEKYTKSAAAVYVISGEDIHRSGVRNIPEALRLAPGVQVARINGNKWAISIRGFSGLYSPYLLVLVDGRSVYSPLFSGVYWEEQDTLLENIERIEVIRGPGGALWGANAVNGIINIITKSAKDTQGGLATAEGGSGHRGVGAVQYGSKLGERAYGRIYLKYFTEGERHNSDGHDGEDDWDALRGGFRIDYDASNTDRFELSGEAYDGQAGQNLTIPLAFPPVMRTLSKDLSVNGGHILGAWTHRASEDSEFALQMYYEGISRDLSAGHERRDTVDVDFQHRLRLSPRHELFWGLGYRFTNNHVTDSYVLSLNPRQRQENLYSATIQDTVTLAEDRLCLTLGTKIEHNDYSGFEIQPSARLLWTPSEKHTVWAAVSRAVQTPSRVFADGRLNIVRFPGFIMSLLGNDDVGSTDLLAYEAGYRIRISERVFLDFTAFYNRYDQLRTAEMGIPRFEWAPFPPHGVIPLTYDNKMSGTVYGVELTANWQATSWWQLAANYSYLEMDLELDTSSTDTRSVAKQDYSPRHQFRISSFMNLPHGFEFDTHLYYVDELPGKNIPYYVRFDARLGWRISDSLEASVCGQNLFDGHRLETISDDSGIQSTEAPRGVYGKVSWRF